MCAPPRRVTRAGFSISTLRSLAGRSAGLLNLSDLARDVGVAVNTARDWLAILEASFQVFLLPPYHVNLGKRLVKSPKIYFTDTGLLCYLVGCATPSTRPMGRWAARSWKTGPWQSWSRPACTAGRSLRSTSGARPPALKWT